MMEITGKCIQCGEDIESQDSDYKTICDSCSFDIEEQYQKARGSPLIFTGDRVRIFTSHPKLGVAVRTGTVEKVSSSASKGEPVLFVCLDESIPFFDEDGSYESFDRIWVHRKQSRKLKKK